MFWRQPQAAGLAGAKAGASKASAAESGDPG